MPAPISRRVVSSPVRSALVITASRISSRARHDQRGDQRKRRRGRIGRHRHHRRLKLRLADERDAAAVLAIWLDADLGAEMLEHALGVVARRLRLDHRGFARRGEAGQQHRRFQLRRRHRQLVGDRDRIARADAASAAAGRPRRPRSHARPSSPAARARAASAACARMHRRRMSPSPGNRPPRR